ncbi:MAG: malectin domain-containing carbohydrate-binding protein, partial [Calditrichia bacterium]
HIQSLVYSQKLMMNIWPPDYPGWVGTLTPSALPVFAYYDWARYSAYTPGTGDNFTEQWTDDFDNWDQTRWGKGNHTWTGNNSDFIPQNVVFQDGYLILCLTPPNPAGYSGAAVADQDVAAPYLVWARSYPGQIKVFFSEEVDQISAEDPSHYIAAGLTISNAVLQPDNRTVVLTADGIDLTVAYTLLVLQIKDRAQPANVTGFQSAVVKTPVILPGRINAGGSAWNTYLQDQVWDYGQEYGHVGGYEFQNAPNLQINGTDEDEIYRTEQRGITFYELRVPDGSYDVMLKFTENQYNSSGQRVFDIYAESQLLKNDLDIYDAVGANTAFDLLLPGVAVTDGVLEVYFKPENGETVLCGMEVQSVPSAIRQPAAVPRQFDWQIYPNPFNPSSRISYFLPQSGNVEINLYNIRGQLLKNLHRAFHPAGQYRQEMVPENMASGVYFISFQVDNVWRDTRKIIYLR